jgi:hypothetical protein
MTEPYHRDDWSSFVTINSRAQISQALYNVRERMVLNTGWGGASAARTIRQPGTCPPLMQPGVFHDYDANMANTLQNLAVVCLVFIQGRYIRSRHHKFTGVFL